jgi:hypothetical protein
VVFISRLLFTPLCTVLLTPPLIPFQLNFSSGGYRPATSHAHLTSAAHVLFDQLTIHDVLESQSFPFPQRRQGDRRPVQQGTCKVRDCVTHTLPR